MSILLSNFLYAVGNVLHMVIVFFEILFIVRAVLSWVNPDPYNPIVQFLTNTTEPILSRVRARLPSLGMIDLSVLVVLLLLIFVDMFIVRTILDYASQARAVTVYG